jgi:hypothetical protein
LGRDHVGGADLKTERDLQASRFATPRHTRISTLYLLTAWRGGSVRVVEERVQKAGRSSTGSRACTSTTNLVRGRGQVLGTLTPDQPSRSTRTAGVASGLEQALRIDASFDASSLVSLPDSPLAPVESVAFAPVAAPDNRSSGLFKAPRSPAFAWLRQRALRLPERLFDSDPARLPRSLGRPTSRAPAVTGLLPRAAAASSARARGTARQCRRGGLGLGVVAFPQPRHRVAGTAVYFRAPR